MKKILLLGGFVQGQSLWSIRQGFELLGHSVFYQPTRGCIAANREEDIALAREEAELIPSPETWDLKYRDHAEFQEGLCRVIETHRPGLLLWWFSKDDRPAGLIRYIRDQYPWCRTVTHTQDDPWDAVRSPQFSAEFEFVATCCRESVPLYEKRGIRAIVLYPPPAAGLHLVARPSEQESCDFSVTLMSLYARKDNQDRKPGEAADPAAWVTHYIGFPGQRLLRQEVVEAIRPLGKLHIYGGLGHGTFEAVPRYSYRGFRTYFELPGVYAASRININQHNSPLSHGYLNQRDTAITGSGGFMLTDHVEGIDEIFEVGAEIDTWRTVDELRDKAKWWLGHDRDREQAARRAQKRIFREFGNVAYARKLIEFVG